MFCCVECKIRSKTEIQNVLLTSKPVSTAFALNTTTKLACLARNFSISYQQPYNLRTGTETLKKCIQLFISNVQMFNRK